MFKLKAKYQFATIILFILGTFNVLNGLFHYLWYDSGAGSVAGMDLTTLAGRNIVFMLAVIGEMQIMKGVIYMYVALKEKKYILLLFWIELIAQAASLWLQYGPKHPEPLAPHRYANIILFTICIIVVVLLNLMEKQKVSGDTI
jgi:hypothetical protein